MKRLPMSRAAAGLLRAIVNRAGTPLDRILLTDVESTDWQSLTFVGELHRLSFSISGPEAEAAFDRLTSGLGEAEFHVPRQIVADVALEADSVDADNGTIAFTIEALTIAE